MTWAIADDEVGADGDTGVLEALDLFEETDGMDDHAVGDDGGDVGPQDAGGQQGELVRLAVDLPINYHVPPFQHKWHIDTAPAPGWPG